MSNEFILIAIWRPVNRNGGDRVTNSQYTRLIAKFKFTSQPLKSCKNDLGAISAICDRGMPGVYYLAAANKVYEWSPDNTFANYSLPEGYTNNILGVYMHSDYLVLLMIEAPVIIMKNGVECWRSRYTQNQTFAIDWSWANFSKNNQLVQGSLYVMNTGDHHLLKLDLARLTKALEVQSKITKDMDFKVVLSFGILDFNVVIEKKSQIVYSGRHDGSIWRGMEAYGEETQNLVQSPIRLTQARNGCMVF